MDVLHLRESLATSAVRDHSTYAQALQGLTGAPAWRASAASAASAVPPPPPPPGAAVPPPSAAVPAPSSAMPIPGAAVPMPGAAVSAVVRVRVRVRARARVRARVRVGGGQVTDGGEQRRPQDGELGPRGQEGGRGRRACPWLGSGLGLGLGLGVTGP